jgi:hypothetical protein
MLENYLLNNRIDGWPGLSPARKKELMEQARYNFYANKSRSGKWLLMPFFLLLAAGLLIVALVVINQYYFGASTALYVGGLLVILVALAQTVPLVRVAPLLDEIRKGVADQEKSRS